jgi:hypothetical protein
MESWQHGGHCMSGRSRVADGIVVDAAAALADPEFVGALIVVLPADPLVSQDPAAKARQPVSHDPASWPPAYPPGSWIYVSFSWWVQR